MATGTRASPGREEPARGPGARENVPLLRRRKSFLAATWTLDEGGKGSVAGAWPVTGRGQRIGAGRARRGARRARGGLPRAGGGDG